MNKYSYCLEANLSVCYIHGKLFLFIQKIFSDLHNTNNMMQKLWTQFVNYIFYVILYPFGGHFSILFFSFNK